MLVLDTDALDVADRAEAFQEMVSRNASSSVATFDTHDEHLQADVAHSSLMAQIQAYVRHHLTELDLKPARIAAANSISVRSLYKLYETQGLSLEQTIIEQRLVGARSELADPSGRKRTIAATARAWGFADLSYFSSRFRNAFGMSPREWRSGVKQPTRP